MPEDKSLEEIVQKRFNEVYQSGLTTGCKAMCEVILKKIQDKNKSIPERINSVIKFCNVSLGKDRDEN